MSDKPGGPNQDWLASIVVQLAAVSEKRLTARGNARTCEISSDGRTKTGVQGRSRHNAASSLAAGTVPCGLLAGMWRVTADVNQAASAGAKSYL